MSLRAFIETKFAGLPIISGDFTKPEYDAITVQAPSLVKNATTHDAKHGLKKYFHGDLGLIDFSFVNLAPRDAWGAGIIADKAWSGSIFAAGIHIDLGQNYSVFNSYSTTNRDGLNIDGGEGFYGEDVTVDFFQDGAIDGKPDEVHLNRFLSAWQGHRSIRLWRTGPHVITNSIIDNSKGSILWCSKKATKVYFWNCLFNGQSTIPADKIEKTDDGGFPEVIYLSTKAEAEALMHPGFGDIGTLRPDEMPPVEPPIDPEPPVEPPVDGDLAAQVAANTAAIEALSKRLAVAEDEIISLSSYAGRNNYPS